MLEPLTGWPNCSDMPAGADYETAQPPDYFLSRRLYKSGGADRLFELLRQAC